MTTIEIISLVAGSSVLSVLLNNGISWILQSRRGTANARYLALQVAVILEEFALSCHGIVVDHENYNNSSGNFGKEHDSFAEIAPYPEGADWQALPRDLLARVLNFRNEVKFSKVRIRSQIDLDPNGLPETLSEESAHRGSEAMRLAADLRRKYGLADMQAEYDIAKLLREKHERFQVMDAERRKDP